MRRLLLVSLLPLVSLAAQEPAVAPARLAMDKLAWIEGDWVGQAWTQMGPRREHANQKEHLYRAAGGTVLVIQGVGTDADSGAAPTAVVHDAFAVVTWDATRRQYLFHSYIANGNSVESVAEVGDKRLVWGFEIPGMGRTRFTITLTPGGDWFEIGERTTDQGATWTKFFEMTLKKTSR